MGSTGVEAFRASVIFEARTDQSQSPIDGRWSHRLRMTSGTGMIHEEAHTGYISYRANQDVLADSYSNVDTEIDHFISIF
jgi:hypothetical protein